MRNIHSLSPWRIRHQLSIIKQVDVKIRSRLDFSRLLRAYMWKAGPCQLTVTKLKVITPMIRLYLTWHASKHRGRSKPRRCQYTGSLGVMIFLHRGRPGDILDKWGGEAAGRQQDVRRRWMGKLPDTINKHQQPGRAHSTPSPSDSISHLNHQQFILSDNFSGLNQVSV